jgi:hypothetical protein
VDISYESLAQEFGQLLVAGEFVKAHRRLTASLRPSLSVAELEATYGDMVRYFQTPPNNAQAIETLLEWPDKAADDRAWVYVGIDNSSTDAEAVIVTFKATSVGKKEKLAIGSLEWGRP